MWRTAARRAARNLGRPVRTGKIDHEDADTATVWASLTDWPATDDEAAIDMATKRSIVNAVALAFPIPTDSREPS